VFGSIITALLIMAFLLVVIKMSTEGYTQQKTLAQANEMVSQAQQISMALRIYRSDHPLLNTAYDNKWLIDKRALTYGYPSPLLEAMRDKHYLSSVPRPLVGTPYRVVTQVSFIQNARPVTLDSVILSSSLSPNGISARLCSELNRRQVSAFGCLQTTAEEGNVFWYRYL
jgi:hypothetical protein